MTHILNAGAIVACLLMLIGSAQAESKTGETIDWYVIGSGGGSMSSASYSLSATVGQAAVGTVGSASYALNQGFWQVFAAGSGGCTLRGDMNCDGLINITDMTYLIAYLFSGGLAPCLHAHGDVNCDGLINITDMTYLIAFLFSGGPSPCPC